MGQITIYDAPIKDDAFAMSPVSEVQVHVVLKHNIQVKLITYVVKRLDFLKRQQTIIC